MAPSTTRSIPESVKIGDPIGDPVEVDMDDPDVRDTLKYTLDGTDKAFFNIVPGTGQLTARKTLDYEDPTDVESTYTVDGPGSPIANNLTKVEAETDPAKRQRWSQSRSLSTVTDVAEPPMFSEGASTTRSVQEETEADPATEPSARR